MKLVIDQLFWEQITSDIEQTINFPWTMAPKAWLPYMESVDEINIK